MGLDFCKKNRIIGSANHVCSRPLWGLQQADGMMITTGCATVNPPGQQLEAARCRLTRWRLVELHFSCCTMVTRFPLGCGRFSGESSEKPDQLFLQPADAQTHRFRWYIHTIRSPPHCPPHYTSFCWVWSLEHLENIWILRFSAPLHLVELSKWFLCASFINCNIFFNSKS